MQGEAQAVHSTTMPQGAWTSTILIKNIHCASCVSNIRRILSSTYVNGIHHIDVNSLSHELVVLHQSSISLSELCQPLSDAAFEVYSALTVDHAGIKVDEISSDDRGGAWLDAATDFWRPAHRTSSSGKPLERNRWNVCDACRKASFSEISSEFPNKVPQNHDSKDFESSEPWRRDDIQKDTDYTMSHLQSASIKSNDLGPELQAELEFAAMLSIGGMTCASCTSAVYQGLSSLPCVEEVNVTLLTHSARVVFRGSDNLQQIVDHVEDLGYDCHVDNSNPIKPEGIKTNHTSSQRCVGLRIDGMFCKHCPLRIIDNIESTYGGAVKIEKAPTMDDPVMTILYTPCPPYFTIRNIIGTLESVNQRFTANVYTPPSIEQRSQEMQKQEQYRLLIRLVVSFTIGIPTFLIGVVWMSLVRPSNSARQFFEKTVWSGNATRANWALFILATPVFFLAADVFHVRAIKEVRALWRRGSKVPLLQRFYRFGSMNLLISAGTSVAYFASVAVLGIDASARSSSTGQSSTYFDSVVFLTFFILAGRYLEAYSKAKTGNAVSMLSDLRPQEAVLVNSSSLESYPRDSTSNESEDMEKKVSQTQKLTQSINAKLLEIGDIVLVPHGSSPPADGTIVEGTTKFNESSLTGEARAVPKQHGDTVFAGAVNIGDSCSVRVADVGGTSMLDQIVAVVREGQTKRAPIEKVVDVVTAYFVPIITALAIITFVIWLALGYAGALSHKYLNSQQGGWAFWSLEFAIAVFVVACPCGIGLAAPTALFVGSGLAARHGILVRGGGEAFQEASNIDAIVFDKTGTLTDGKDLSVTDYKILVEDEEQALAWSAVSSLEETSTHPLARALLQVATEQAPPALQKSSTSERPGMGLCGTFTMKNTESGEPVTYEAALGNETLMSSLTPALGDLDFFTTTTLSTWKTQSKSIALLALRKILDSDEGNTTTPWKIAAIFAISDPIRPSAIPTITTLQNRGIPVYMLSGDNPSTASAVASTLSIPQDHVFAGVLPTEKADKIRWLQSNTPSRHQKSWLTRHLPQKSKTPNQHAIITFVGDGINDAPALTTASVSISLSGASDIAMHSSSFILLSPSLQNIITLFTLSERVFRRVKFNFCWAVVYNVILVPVAAGCFFKVREEGWRLGPVWGSAAMALSSLCVVGSSLALRWEGGWGGGWLGRVVKRVVRMGKGKGKGKGKGEGEGEGES